MRLAAAAECGVDCAVGYYGVGIQDSLDVASRIACPLVLHFGETEREQYFRVERACRLSRYGGDCYAYALIAMGFVDLVIETDLKRWDVAAIIPILTGAGGVVSDWHGDPITGEGNIVAAGDARVHAEAVKMLRR